MMFKFEFIASFGFGYGMLLAKHFCYKEQPTCKQNQKYTI